MFLVVTRNFPPDIGGIQTLMEGLAKNLAKYGSIKVFADEFKNSEKYDVTSSLDITRIKGIKLFRKYRKANFVNSYLNSNSNVKALFADHWKSLELINTVNLKNIKTFCLIHSKEINHEPNTSLNKRLIKATNKANYIISNSHFTKDLAIKVGINKSKINIIFPGIDKKKDIKNSIKAKSNAIYKDSFPKIITVSRLDKRKGHDKILMALKNLKSIFPKIKYVSIGSGKEENNLLKLRKELNLENNITFLKDIDYDYKLALISSANLFLMPSRIENKSVEGFGISFIEAASCGVASIGGKQGGEKDSILHNKTGLLCDGNDLNSIYESINLFFKNENFIKYGVNALEFSRNFHWDKVIKKYLKLIN